MLFSLTFFTKPIKSDPIKENSRISNVFRRIKPKKVKYFFITSDRRPDSVPFILGGYNKWIETYVPRATPRLIGATE